MRGVFILFVLLVLLVALVLLMPYLTGVAGAQGYQPDAYPTAISTPVTAERWRVWLPLVVR